MHELNDMVYFAQVKGQGSFAAADQTLAREPNQ